MCDFPGSLPPSLPPSLYLHQYAHNPPAIIRTTLRKCLVQLDGSVLLLLVVPHSDISHKQVREDFLVLGVMGRSISIHLSYLQI